MRLVYVVGQPGAGKTALLDATFDCLPRQERGEPFAHSVYSRPYWVRLGKAREHFGGTDALPMNVQPRVVLWLADSQPTNVVAEGDRLANPSFFAAAARLGYCVEVVHLDTPDALAADRRAERGSAQDPTWVRGRITKVRNLVLVQPPALVLNGRASVAGNAAVLRAYLGLD